MSRQVEELVEIAARLRAPDGCPWDQERTLKDVMEHLQNELDEVKEAWTEGDPTHIREELGDLLFNIVFATQLADEKGWFDLGEVVGGIVDKLIRRHPHVYGNETASTAEEALKIWNRVKSLERASGSGRAPQRASETEGKGRPDTRS